MQQAELTWEFLRPSVPPLCALSSQSSVCPSPSSGLLTFSPWGPATPGGPGLPWRKESIGGLWLGPGEAQR